MTPIQRVWAQARDQLASALVSLGYPDEFAGLLAKQLKSPKAIDRMTSYLRQAHPASTEMIVDEMLAICAEIDAWRDRKASLEAQESYNAWLESDERWQNDEDQ